MSARASENDGGFRVRAAVPEDVPAIRAVILAVRTEHGVHGEMGANDPDLDDLAANYLDRGAFEVIEDPSSRLVGCAGLRPLNADRAELCKMYIEKRARGRGLGRRLLDDMMAAARRGGFREVWLETNSVLAAARKLYLQYGFQPVPSEHLLPKCDQAYLLRLEDEPSKDPRPG